MQTILFNHKMHDCKIDYIIVNNNISQHAYSTVTYSICTRTELLNHHKKVNGICNHNYITVTQNRNVLSSRSIYKVGNISTSKSICIHKVHSCNVWYIQIQLLTPGHEAPKLKLSLITSTWLHLIISKIFIILHHLYCCYVFTLYNLFAHSSCTFLSILLFIKSTVYCLLILFYSYFFTSFFFHTHVYVYSHVFMLHIIALSMEWIWFTFHCWLYSVKLCMWQRKILNVYYTANPYCLLLLYQNVNYIIAQL